ncbi:MAG: hypothetical protein ABI977_34775 [Acidobacteriota bacterium]
MPLPATIPNPFRSSIVSDPWQVPETDVAAVHEAAFEQCCAAVAAVRINRRTTSVLVQGEPGSGKTHLLARLHAHIAREAEADGPGGLQEAIFISVRLQTGPRMIWRHLRDRFASDLLRRTADGSQLDRLLLHRLSEGGFVEGDGRAWLQHRRREANGTNAPCPELEELFDQIDTTGYLSHSLRTVLGHLFLGRHRGLAGSWLRGESLPETALQRLEVISGQDGDDELEEQGHRLALALSTLATPDLPVIFCFDQIEALQTHPEDNAGLFAFGQMVSALHDETKHALLISCVQAAFLNTLRAAVRKPDYDRLVEFDNVYLKPLTWDEAEQLIKARMNLLPELATLRAQHQGLLWPLREEQIKSVFEHNRCLARKLITHCSELFEAQRSGANVITPTASVPEFLNQAFETRQQKALEESKPSQTEKILAHGLPLLFNLADRNLQQQRENLPADVDLMLGRSEGKVAVSICNSQHWPSLVRKLKRLNAQLGTPQLNRLVLLRDGRLPIGAKAVKTRELREQLIRKGARWIEPSIEALAALDALRCLLADAQSGDLDNRGDAVELKTVQDWLAEHLVPELKDLIEDIFPADSGGISIVVDDWPLYEDIAELLQRHHVIAVADLAATLEREETEVAECARQHAHQIGVLGEPPVALFRLVNDVVAVERQGGL